MRFRLIVTVLLFTHPLFAQHATWLVKPAYEAISPFNDGVAMVKLNGKYGYINDKGVEIVKPGYDFAYDFSNGSGVITLSDKTTIVAIVDATGKVVKPKDQLKIDSRFAAFSDGLLLVNNGKKWGYLNRSGVLSIACKYFSAQPFSEGLAAVRLDNYWYYINAAGQTVIPPDAKKVIYWAMGFHDGQAPLLLRDGMKYIDTKGKELSRTVPKITPPEEYEQYFHATLPCKEGELVFDNRCRAIVFVDKNKTRTELAKITPKPSPAIKNGDLGFGGIQIDYNSTAFEWQNASMAITNFPGMPRGIISLVDQSVVQLNVPPDTLKSVFGSPVKLSLSIKNTSNSPLSNLSFMVNGKNMTTLNIDPAQSRSLEIVLPKETESAVEAKNLALSVEDYGLLLGGWSPKVMIKDVPSIAVSIPNPHLSVCNTETFVAFVVRVENKTLAEEAKDIMVRINNQPTEPFSLQPGKSRDIRINVPIDTKMMNVQVKPKLAPEIQKQIPVNVTSVKCGEPESAPKVEPIKEEKEL